MPALEWLLYRGSFMMIWPKNYQNFCCFSHVSNLEHVRFRNILQYILSNFFDSFKPWLPPTVLRCAPWAKLEVTMVKHKPPQPRNGTTGIVKSEQTSANRIHGHNMICSGDVWFWCKLVLTYDMWHVGRANFFWMDACSKVKEFSYCDMNKGHYGAFPSIQSMELSL